MKDDQRVQLEAMLEEVTDVALEEVNPKNWDGGDAPLSEMTNEERGNRYWCKKNAAATLTLITKMQSILAWRSAIDPKGASAYITPEPEPEDNVDAEIRNAEKEVNRILRRVRQDREKAR